MRRVALVRKLIMLAVVMVYMSVVHSTELTGQVIAVNNLQGIAQASVTLVFPEAVAGPKTITVFTGSDGSFRFPADLLKKLKKFDKATLEASKLGYKQVRPAAGALQVTLNKASGRYETKLYVEPLANIAGQVPGSAWLAAAPAGTEKNILLASCTNCHQMPDKRTREFAAQIEAVTNGPEGNQKALEAWRKVVRHESWRTIVKYMRPMHYSVFPLESATNIGAVDWETAKNADYNFYTERQGEIVAQYLADHFPRQTVSMSRDAYTHGATLGVTEKTVIREFSFPKTALVRELVAAPNSPYLWGADVKRGFLVRLNPENGETKWYPVDYKGTTGPHTIAPDDAGMLWVSMIDNGQFGRFDPKTEKWKLWTLRPSKHSDSLSMGVAPLVHDMSIDSRGYVARDAFGKIWLTIVSTNQLGTLDPDSGEVAFYNTKSTEGLSPINHLLYSTVLTADGKCAWYTQVMASVVGCINTSSKQIEKPLSFPEGAGPRRIARDNEGNLWVALFGSGQVAKIDMTSGKLLETFDMPDRSAAPYAVTWDERRKAVWVANANSDSIYHLDPSTGKIKVYPMPRQMAFFRQIAVDQKSGRLVGTYSNYPEGSGPSMGVLIDVGD